MKNSFQFSAIDYQTIEHFFNLSPAALKKAGAVRSIADSNPGFPCRVSLSDAKIGEEVILFPYTHHDVTSPYQATGPIFVRKDAPTAFPNINEIPSFLNHRLLSLRVYDHAAMMIDAHTVKSLDLRETIDTIFTNKHASYIQVHNAGPGCYNCQVDRAEGKGLRAKG